MTTVTTVVIADDHPMVRQGLRAVLDASPDLEVVGEAGDGQEDIDLVLALSPDVVLMDLQMPEVHGIDATRQIAARGPSTAVLVLTMYEDDDTVFAAVGAGAAGYLLKGSDGGDIVAAVRSAAAGQAVFGPSLARRLREWFTGRPAAPAAPAAFPELTDRERDILDLLAAGLTNAAIGDRLHLSVEGIVVPVVVLDKQTGRMESAPEIVTRGFVDDDERGAELLGDAGRLVAEAVASRPEEERHDPALTRERLRQELRRFFRKRTQRRPMVIPVVMEV